MRKIMKFKSLILFFICFLVIACKNEDIITITRYQGMVLEQSEKQPLSGLLTMLTDGTNVFDSTRTAVDGKFFLTADWTIMDGNYYLFIDGEERYPSKKIDLNGTKQEQFDFFYLYLYDKQTTEAAPSIKEDISIKYVNQKLEFSNIVISSPYTLTETSIILINQSGREIRYPLIQTGKTYSVTIDGLSIGEWYKWAIFAKNEIDNTTTNYHNLLYGFQTISIRPITEATLNSISISCSISGDCPYTTDEVGFCWGNSDYPNMTNSVKASIIGNTFTATITNMNFTGNTYIRAYIHNQNGTAYTPTTVLKAYNPLNWFEFDSEGKTYTVYEFHKEMNWYQAVSACQNLEVCFDDWSMPNYLEVAAYVSAYIREYQVLPYTNIWASRRDFYFEDGESETFLSTPNGLIMESKQNKHSVVAIRKY